MPETDERLLREASMYGLEAITQLGEVRFSKELLSGISDSWARKNQALPAEHAGERVLLSARPDCLETLQQAQLMTGRALQPRLLTQELLQEAIAQAFAGEGTKPAGVQTRVAESGGDEKGTARGAEKGLEKGLEKDASFDLHAEVEVAPPVRTLNALLQEAIRRQASDIHFEPWPGGLRVRFRIDGGLYEQAAPPAGQMDAIISRLKVMARMDIAERRLPQDGMAQVRSAGRVVDIRVSSIPVADGERVVLRLLDRNNAWQPLDQLGMEPAVLEPFSALLARPHGLVVVSGPTGSGKTTTLYSALSTLDSARRNILTVEDPVEYRLPSIGQIQVKPKIGLTFAAGLRHILRQDPDVILVGETRDPETAEIAVRAALTGHLVFTTLHTNDAPSVVARLVDIGVEPYLLASCLRGVLAQRLVRRLCPQCRRACTHEAMLPGELGAHVRGATLYEAVGCEACLEGYRGRLGLFEYMGVGESVAESIRQKMLDGTALRMAAERDHAFQPMVVDAARKLLSGATDAREAQTALL